MGGYGATTGNYKIKGFLDSHDQKVTDKNAIAVGKYLIEHGEYVVFLHESSINRADISVDGIHVEIKGISSTNLNTITKEIKHAFIQVNGDNWRYDKSTHRKGKVILLSKHPSLNTAYKIFYASFRNARKKGYVDGKVEMWFPKDKDSYYIYKFN